MGYSFAIRHKHNYPDKMRGDSDAWRMGGKVRRMIMMWEYIEERTRKSGEYIAETGCTVRACAAHFGVSKSTVHKDVMKRNGSE